KPYDFVHLPWSKLAVVNFTSPEACVVCFDIMKMVAGPSARVACPERSPFDAFSAAEGRGLSWKRCCIVLEAFTGFTGCTCEEHLATKDFS
ncbi:Serine/threonine-protein phosphatase rdgC, partial [Durusdinium trenchii]